MSAPSRGSRTKVKQQGTKLEPIALKATLTAPPKAEDSKNMEPEKMDIGTPEPSMQLLAEAAQNDSRELGNGITGTVGRDDRSSSLSDLDDRPATEATDQNIEQSSQVSEEEDTEAETERLDESPYKDRQQKKVLLSATHTNGAASSVGDDVDGSEATIASGEVGPATNTEPEQNGAQEKTEAIVHSSGSSSLGDSAGASMPDSPTSTGSKKRKRESEEDETSTSLKKVALELAQHVADHVEDIEEASSPVRAASVMIEVGADEGDPSEEESLGDENGEEGNVNGGDVDIADTMDSAGEDVDLEYAGQEADVGLSIRSEEELKKKKAALDMLSKIENDFAVLRDKLFADKSNQLATELATIQSNNITHPEYLAMVEAIDNQKRERIDHAKTVFRYKFQALQTKSIANRAQLHSQYFQAIRQLRETSLENASKEWYQIQRERRSIDEEKNSTINHFVGNRSQLVAQQTAYNLEVSVLSGIAKHVGFPAAPEIQGATQSEIDEDLRNMGISRHQVPAPVLPHFLRQKPAAEEQFLEQNPWANAQHPYHSQIANNQARHISGNLRSTSPFTPISQKRVGIAAPTGSASTIAALASSSLAPTPVSNDLGSSSVQPLRLPLGTEFISDTPSRVPDLDITPGTRKAYPSNEPVSNNHSLTGDKIRSSRSPGVSHKLINAVEEVDLQPNSSPLRHTTHTLADDVGSEDKRMQSGFSQHSSLPSRVEVGNA